MKYVTTTQHNDPQSAGFTLPLVGVTLYPGAIIWLIIIAGALLGAPPAALAQGGGDAISESVNTFVTAIVDIIQSITVGVGILGAVTWGFGMVARPWFPEISQRTQGFLQKLVVGSILVFGGTAIVEGFMGSLQQ